MAHIDRRPGIRPRPSIGRRLDIIARVCFPGCVTLLLMLFTQAPMGIPGQAVLLPAVTLGSVWFWSLVRPDSMPPPLVFLLGILADLMGYLPLGVCTFTLLAVHGLAFSLRRRLVHAGFALIWIAFGIVAFAASILIWLLVMLLTFRLFTPMPALFQALLACAVYPILAIPFSAAHRSIANTDQL